MIVARFEILISLSSLFKKCSNRNGLSRLMNFYQKFENCRYETIPNNRYKKLIIFYLFFFLLENGCYYNYNHYGEGDRIMTNEPCLNCTCHNKMLMCYLRVCPFTKPIGQDCTIEKREDQCCPVITCPEGKQSFLFHFTIVR